MKKFASLVLFLALTIAASGSVSIAQKAQVEIDDIINSIGGYFDAGKFTGQTSYFTIYGLKQGPVTLVIENAEGKRVFEHKYKCDSNGDDTPSCYMTQIEGSEPKPYAVAAGMHTFKILHEDKEIYTLKYKISSTEENGWKEIWVNGDWERMAEFDSSFETKYVKTVIYGISDKCGGNAPDAQVTLYRNGTLIARGHNSPGDMYYGSCYTSFMLFNTDENQFTKWLTYDELKSKDGGYELKYYIDKKLIKTYGFNIEGGKITGTPPADLQQVLKPESLSLLKNSIYFYTK